MGKVTCFYSTTAIQLVVRKVIFIHLKSVNMLPNSDFCMKQNIYLLKHGRGETGVGEFNVSLSLSNQILDGCLIFFY